MNVVETILRKPCCSSRYNCGPQTFTAGIFRARAASTRDQDDPTNLSAMSAGAKKYLESLQSGIMTP